LGGGSGAEREEEEAMAIEKRREKIEGTWPIPCLTRSMHLLSLYREVYLTPKQSLLDP
jgi:hypothetical protein